MARGGGRPLKVFCSYRSSDVALVEAFATRLREAGLDAWFDRWEMEAGDDIVARMDEGVDGCHAALIFISEAWFDGKWAYDEYTTLALRRVEDGIRVIPVLLADVADRLPGRLRKLARRSVEDFEAIRDTLLGVDHRPGLAHAQQAPTRHVELVLAEAAVGRLSSELIVDGDLRARAEAPVPSDWDLAEATSPALLAELGRRVGTAILAGDVGTTLQSLLGDLGGAVVDLCVSAPPALITLPFEAARLPGGAALGLAAPVRMWRRLAGGEHPVPPPAPGPLKVLVAVGAPDEGQSPAQPLDIEAEMGSVLDALGDAVRDERAQVRFLEATDVASIAAAVGEDDYHVLHISGHGRGEAVELADEDGLAVAVTAAQLIGALQEAGKVLPLVFVSACAGGTTPRGFAYDLARQGVARVLAMTTTVSDAYATALAAAFYRHLSIAAWPRAAVALAAARRQVEATAPDRARGPRPEWATPALLLAGEDGPLVDADLSQVGLRRSPVYAVDGPVPPVAMGSLIGRRPQVRTTLRALQGHPRFAADHGAVGAVVLTGTGGVGKSTVAGRIMARLAEDRWVCAAVDGHLSLAGICRTLATEAAASSHPWAAQAAAVLAGVGDDDASHLAALERALRRWPLLVVLDNFEDNLTTGGEGFVEEATGLLCQRLVDAATVGKVLITCRYRLGMLDGLHQVALGPLSGSETRRLFLRLEGLRLLEGPDVALVRSLVGGHPRVLELLDALLRRGASVATVRPKLRALAQAEGIVVDADRDLPSAVTEAVRMGARDIVLDELLATLGPAERAVLLQAAVSGLPVAPEDLSRAVGQEEGPTTTATAAATVGAISRLVDLSLLVAVGEGVWVHRWTAEALRARQSPQDYRDRCRRAAELRLARLESGGEVSEWIEVTENFLAAEAWDEAMAIATDVANFLARTSTVMRAGFAGRVRTALPSAHPDYKVIADHEAEALVALGFTEAAIRRYAELVADHRALAEAEPNRADYQRDLSVSFIKLGDLMVAVGQGEEAARLFNQSLDIRQALAEAEPDRADYQRDLSVSYERLGDVAARNGQTSNAVRYFHESLAIWRRLAELSPTTVDFRYGQRVPLGRLAGLLVDADPDAGVAAMAEALQIVIEVARAQGPAGVAGRALGSWVRQADEAQELAATAGSAERLAYLNTLIAEAKRLLADS